MKTNIMKVTHQMKGECWVSHTFNITSFSLVVGSECETICYSGVAAAAKQFIYEIL
jgi:hypothetical protein